MSAERNIHRPPKKRVNFQAEKLAVLYGYPGADFEADEKPKGDPWKT